MITLTDPSLMRSVPLQLEKILDVVCQPMVRADGGKDDTPLIEGWDGSRKDAFKANPSWSDTREKI